MDLGCPGGPAGPGGSGYLDELGGPACIGGPGKCDWGPWYPVDIAGTPGHCGPAGAGGGGPGCCVLYPCL